MGNRALNPKHDARFLKIDDVAGRANVSSVTIRAWISKGIFPKPRKFGRLRRWHPDVVEKFMRDREAGEQEVKQAVASWLVNHERQLKKEPSKPKRRRAK